MKTLIIQYYIDINLYSQPEFNGIGPTDVEKYSEYSFKKYCNKYGHDFLRVTEPNFGYMHPTWERFDLWFNKKWLDKYDQILYVDTDVFALDHAPDIFAQYNDPDTFKSPAYRKYRGMALNTIKNNFKDTIIKDCNPQKVRDIFFQTGVWMVTRSVRDQMMPWVERYKEFKCDDGQFLNWSVIESGVKYQDMDPRFNFKNNGLKISFNPKDVWFLHVAGGKKYKVGNRIYNFLKETFPAVNLNV